ELQARVCRPDQDPIAAAPRPGEDELDWGVVDDQRQRRSIAVIRGERCRVHLLPAAAAILSRRLGRSAAISFENARVLTLSPGNASRQILACPSNQMFN